MQDHAKRVGVLCQRVIDLLGLSVGLSADAEKMRLKFFR